MTRRGTLHLPVNTLALRRGGLVKAVMLRANALAAADPGRNVVIEVLGYQARLEEDVAELIARGFLHPAVHVRSLLRVLDPSVRGPSDVDPIVGCAHHGVPLGRAPRVGRPALGRAVDPRALALADPHSITLGGHLLHRAAPQVKSFDASGRLRHADVMDRRARLIHRLEYGSGNRVNRILDFRPGDKRPAAQRWIGVDGRCFLAVWLQPDGRQWATAYVADDEVKVMSSPTPLYVLALQRGLRDERDPVLFSEFRESLPNLPARGFDDVVLAVQHPTVRRVAVFHSNHTLGGSDRRRPFRSSGNFSALLTGLGRWDMVVTATGQQRDDIAEQYGHRDRLVAIAHYAPEPVEDLDPEDYEADRFVLVARIHRKKRVDEAIRAFRLVADKRPTARLEVFGFGYGDELEASITRLVADLGLRDNVVFRGFVEDTGSIYAGACASLQTSESEGFGMALLESLAAGVPVVAYDVAYGAREAIRDDVDGYVVPWGDREALAQRLLALAEDPGLRTRLAAAAPAGAARFSRDRYVREWTAALAALPVRESESTVTAARVVDGKLELTVDGTGALVLRPRGGGADLEAPIEDGTASFELPGLADGAILDVFLRDGEREIRARATGPAESDDPTWSVYATAYGNLSLKRLRVARIGRPAAASAPRWRRWAGTLGDRPIRWVTAVRGGR